MWRIPFLVVFVFDLAVASLIYVVDKFGFVVLVDTLW